MHGEHGELLRPGGHGEPHQLHGRGVGRLLRRALLDHVEATHVQVPGLSAGAVRDPGVQEGVPRLLHPRPRLRQQAPGPDLRLRRLPPQVSQAKQPTIRRLLAPVRLFQDSACAEPQRPERCTCKCEKSARIKIHQDSQRPSPLSALYKLSMRAEVRRRPTLES
jgi:hypothetical protein